MTATASTLTSSVFVHPNAICESGHVGDGTRVWAFAHVMDGARVGKYCNICDHAFIERGSEIGDRVTVKNGAMIWEGVTIEDDVFVGPAVVFTNDRYPRSPRMPEAAARYHDKTDWLVPTTVRRGATIGAGAVVLCGVTIGRHAGIAAGAVVTRNVPDHRLVLGHPAHPIGWVCVCGVPLGDDLACTHCRREYETHTDTLIARE